MPRRSAAPARARVAETKADSEGLEINVTEKILSDVTKLYDGKDGVTQMSKDIGLSLLSPRRKVNVMIMGNHSAGKSSFVNWYCDEHVQSTGVAVESQGFTVITRGKRKEPAPIKGPGVLHMFPHLQTLETKFGKGLVENLSTQVSISDSKMFPLIDFVDTPGLVDGNVEYPFDVNEVIEELAEYADLILVFLDPIGQALCSRTMAVVSALNKTHYNKMRYYLTKADTVGSQEDLMKVICQITQNLCEHIHNTHGFSIPAIFIPTADRATPAVNSKVNALGQLCADLETTIKQKVQDNLNTLKDNCDSLLERVATIEAEERSLNASRGSLMRWSYFIFMAALCLPLLALLVTLNLLEESLPASVASAPWFKKGWGAVEPFVEKLQANLPHEQEQQMQLGAYIMGAFLLAYLTSKFLAYRATRYVVRSSASMRKVRVVRSRVPGLLQEQKAMYKRYIAEVLHSDGH